MHTLDIDFVRKYKKQFKLVYEHGIDGNHQQERISAYIPSRISPCSWSGQKFQVYQFGPGTLAAIMPVQKSRNLIQEFTFLEVHTEADDCTILLFDETDLHKVADSMKLRKRRSLSKQHKQALLQSSEQHRFTKSVAFAGDKTG